MTNETRITDWKISTLRDLGGKCYLITGANSGIGYAAAEHLRRANADVFIACRSRSKGADALAELAKTPSHGALHLVKLDLASVESIRQSDAAIRELTDGLDGIVNNAGIMAPPQQKTADGFELQFGTNHLGHFMLNYLIFDLIEARSGRIVPVSSMVHRQAPGINFNDPMFSKDYSPSKAYTQSKLANLMYGLELARRLEAAGSSVKSVSSHPGYSATHLQSTGPTGVLRQVWKVTNRLALKPNVGSQSEVLAVASIEARNGAYYGPTKFGDTRGPVGDSRISAAAQDEVAAAKLWTLSEDLLAIKWSII